MQAILTWLGQMGFQAVRRMPGGVFPELTGAVVAVSVEKAEAKDAADALLTQLSGGVKGLTITKLSAQECRYVQDGDCFCCKVGAQVQAYLYALANEEETEFTEFILKGEVQ